MGIPFLPDPPAEWDTATTLYMAGLLEAYNDLKEDARKRNRNRKHGPPAGLTARDAALWEQAASRDYALVTEDGKTLKKSDGNPVRFSAGDKSYDVDDEDFNRQWQEFMRSELSWQYAERLKRHGVKIGEKNA